MTLEPLHSGFTPELIKKLTVPHKRSHVHRICLVFKDHLKQQCINSNSKIWHIGCSGLRPEVSMYLAK